MRNTTYTYNNKQYELSIHLGNVLVTTSDLRKGTDIIADGIADYYNAIVTTANDYYAFGSLMGGRQYNSTSYRYGYGGHEKDNEVSGEGNHLAFGDYGYDTRLGRRWNIDPKSSKYPFASPFVYALNSPIAFIDPDGKEVKGFSINDKGDVVITKQASKDAVAIYNAMAKTGMGLKAFKDFVTSETKVTLNLTSKPIEGAHGLTQGEGKTANGYYEKATVTISTAKTGDRFDNAESNDEIINVVGTHESVHATNKEQIATDQSLPEGTPFTWEQESLPINTEYSAWKEWRTQNKQDIEPIKKIYETPSAEKKDPAGNPKPAQYGVDANGKVLTEPQAEPEKK